MSEQWRGLHNPERHKAHQPDTRCVRCHGGYEVCEPDAPCWCCLAAEVEALRERANTMATVIQRQESTFERQMEEHAELEALRAQVAELRGQMDG